MLPENKLIPKSVTAAARRSSRFGVGFGRRFFLLIAVGLLWAVPAFWNTRFLLLMLAWDALAFLAWAIDLSRLPRPHQLVIERSWSGPAALSDNVEVTISVQNLSGTQVECRVLDDVPEALRTVPPTVTVRAARADSSLATY